MKIQKKIHRQETRLLHQPFFWYNICQANMFKYIAEVFSQLSNLNPNLHQEQNRMQQTFKYMLTFIYQIYAKCDLRSICAKPWEEKLRYLKVHLKGRISTLKKSGISHIHWSNPTWKLINTLIRG